MRELIIGGARSGKSALALQRAHDSSKSVTFVATAQALDAEMSERIARHRGERPKTWMTVESPLQLAETLAEVDAKDRFVIVDCLTLWLSNIMCSTTEDNSPSNELVCSEYCDALIGALEKFSGDIVLITNEVGMGIVPDNVLARRFRDEQGRLNQQVARICERVTLVVAGIPISIKTPPET